MDFDDFVKLIQEDVGKKLDLIFKIMKKEKEIALKARDYFGTSF
jgi:hypothetical protein